MVAYREIAPAGPVGDLLECAWQGRSGSVHARSACAPLDAPRAQRVLPDGCMDLIVLDGRLVVAGPDTTAHLATPAPGSVTTGLRFRPGALPALLGVPANVLRDQRVELSDVLDAERDTRAAGRIGDSRGVPFDDRHRASGDDLALLLDTAAALGARPGDRRPLPEPLPDPALRALARGMPAGELANRLGVTSRTLHRRCLATLGYGPSVARRVLRFRRASGLLFDGVAPAEVATRTGYADQPHLSREVRELAGVSPAALAGS